MSLYIKTATAMNDLASSFQHESCVERSDNDVANKAKDIKDLKKLVDKINELSGNLNRELARRTADLKNIVRREEDDLRRRESELEEVKKSICNDNTQSTPIKTSVSGCNTPKALNYADIVKSDPVGTSVIPKEIVERSSEQNLSGPKLSGLNAQAKIDVGHGVSFPAFIINDPEECAKDEYRGYFCYCRKDDSRNDHFYIFVNGIVTPIYPLQYSNNQRIRKFIPHWKYKEHNPEGTNYLIPDMEHRILNHLIGYNPASYYKDGDKEYEYSYGSLGIDTLEEDTQALLDKCMSGQFEPVRIQIDVAGALVMSLWNVMSHLKNNGIDNPYYY